PFGEGDLPSLALLAALAGLALRNAALYSEAARARAALETAVGAARDLGSETELSRVFERLIDRAVDIGSADAGAIVRLEDEAIVVEASSTQTAPGSRWDVPRDIALQLREGRILTFGSDADAAAGRVTTAD